MGKVALGNVFLRLLQLSAISFIPPMVHTRLHLCVILIGRAMGKAWKASKSSVVSEIRVHWIRKYFQ